MNFEMIQYYTFPLYAMNSAQYSIVLEYEPKSDMKQKAHLELAFKSNEAFTAHMLQEWNSLCF